ncbi:hypothetical protein NQL31_002440 [Lotmaria passim]
MHHVPQNVDDAQPAASHIAVTTETSTEGLGNDTVHTASNSSPSQDTGSVASTNSVFSLFRRLLTQNDVAYVTGPGNMPNNVSAPSSATARSRQGVGNEAADVATAACASALYSSSHPRRLKVAVVGEAESGRTTLCRSLEAAAERKTSHPLVVSGQTAAALKMDVSVLSVQTYDVACKDNEESTVTGKVVSSSFLTKRGEDNTLEVTVVDSGPAPLSEGGGTMAVMEADVVLLCFPLYGIKQVVSPEGNSGGGFGLFRAAKPTEAFLHARDCQLLTTLLTLLSTRCGGDWSSPHQLSTLPSVFLIGTFQDVLKDASVAATHTILGSLQRLCGRVRQQSPSILPITDVYAVSAVQATAVSLSRTCQFALRDCWHELLHLTATAAAAAAAAIASSRHEPSHDLFISSASLLHLLVHPNRLQILSMGARRIYGGNSSPRLLDASVGTSLARAAAPEAASAKTRAEDSHVASLMVDFVTQLKARKRVWMLPLPELWRVAYALGMQTREQLYLMLRQMEATGEVSLFGRGLSYMQQSGVGVCGATNETVCFCPALLRTSYSILYVYVDWVAHRQRRHVRQCLRGVDLDECALCDPTMQAAKGTFPLPLLRCLAGALSLKKTSSPHEAAELLISALVGSDAAYLTRHVRSNISGTGIASATAHPQDPLQPPEASPGLPLSSRRASHAGQRGSREAIAASPLRSRGLVGWPSTDTMAGDLSSTSSTAGDLSARTPSMSTAMADATTNAADDFSPNITVAELTSLFLLGELTSAQETTMSAAAASSSAYKSDSLGNVSFDPVRAAMQRTARPASPARRQQPAEDEVVLVVPSLQPSALCPDAVAHHLLRCASRTNISASSSSGAAPALGVPTLYSSQVLLHVHPFPYDFVSLLTCRFASIAHRVEWTYSNAGLLSFHVGQLLQPTTNHISLCHVSTGAAAEGAVDGCCFFCVPPSNEIADCSAVLRLVTFADSKMRVGRLASALCTELRWFLLQRLPGVTIAPELDMNPSKHDAADGGAVDCATVADLLCSLHTVR